MWDGQTLPATGGFYPERDELPEPFGDRLLGELGFLVHRWFRGRTADPPKLAVEAGQRVEQLEDVPPASRIPELRYRLRRGGFSGELLAQCWTLYRIALHRAGRRAPVSETPDAAHILLKGGVAQLAHPAERVHALGLAAVAMVVRGTPVHLLTATDVRAKWLQGELEEPLRALEIAVGCVQQGMDARARLDAYASPIVCGAQREIAADYLRDRLSIGSKQRRVLGALERLAGDAPAQRLLMRGLHCALVEEADRVLLDDARAPLIISTEAEESHERLNYEQALELARALKVDTDFVREDGGAALTPSGAERLQRLVQPLGGIWAGRQRREELIGMTLEALFDMERNVHYRVEKGRVSFPEPDPEKAEEHGGISELMRRLVEVKEGCRLSGRHVVLAKIAMPRFTRRYLHVAGVCADARGLEREFWSLYRLKTTLVDGAPPRSDWRVRVFAGHEAKVGALRDALREAAARGCAVLVAARTPNELSAILPALEETKSFTGFLSGRGDDAERAALAGLDRPGSVAATLYPAERNVRRERHDAAPLHVVVAELHDAQRHVGQIGQSYGACSGEMLFSLDDEAMKARLSATIARLARAGVKTGGELPPARSRWIARLAQREAERAMRLARDEAVSAERHRGELLAFSGWRE